MPTLSRQALSLAGFTLAHAVWSVSDTAEDDLLCPLAMLELDGERRLVRFEAATQEAAVAQGKAAMDEARKESNAWAFAHEATWRPSGAEQPAQDLIVVECWSEGMDVSAVVLQPFARATKGDAFRLLESPTLAVNGYVVDAAVAEPALGAVRAGVESHEVAGRHWAEWERHEAPDPEEES
jgi:hypothetical protein